jgi:methyl-accepting chemotaxis protein
MSTIVYIPVASYIGRGSVIKRVAIIMTIPFLILAFTSYSFGITRNYFLFVPALGGLFSTFYVLSKYVQKPFAKLENAIKQIADGNLTNLNIDDVLSHNNEIGKIGQSIADLDQKLNEIVSGIKEVSGELVNHSNQLLKTSQVLANGTSVQAASTEEISSSIEEAVSIIDQSSTNAIKAKDISKKAAKGIETNYNQTETTNNSIKHIYDNIDKINQISQATRILSLNAAVEAARAGEHGRGFSVVAGEVQKLADNSKIFSDAIQELATSALSNAEMATKSLGQMAPEVHKTASLVDEISIGSLEQKQAMDQIATSIQELNNVTQKTSANGEEMSANAHQLKDQSFRLNELINFFKTS